MTEQYARVCDECGKGTNVGYYADGSVYCTDKCLNVHISPEEWNTLYDEGEGDFYYTQWDKRAEIEHQGFYYDAAGVEHQVA